MAFLLASEDIADLELIAAMISAVLSVELSFNHIQWRRGDRGNRSRNATADIIFEALVSFPNSKVMLQLLVEGYDQRAERDVHSIVNWEATIKGNGSLASQH